MKYKGDPIVKTQTGLKTNSDGTVNYSESFLVVPDGAVPTSGSPQTVRTKNGAFDAVEVTYANINPATLEAVPTDKWEDDTETLEKDLMYSELAQPLSEEAKQEVMRWRKNPETKMDFSNAVLQLPTDQAIMQALMFEVLRGVETISIVTSVLKRTRTTPSGYLTPRKVSVTLEFYSTAQLIAREGIPADVQSQMPDDGAAVEHAKWGWMPRNSTRQFTGRGRCEESSDWIFAAWSTYLYIFVA